MDSPLKPAELQVLRAQYEKEGEYVGVQTKFNYAWVRIVSLCKPDCLLEAPANICTGPDKVKLPAGAAGGHPAAV